MRKPESLQAGAARIVRSLKDKGHVAFWAGGCVRDMLLGMEPSDIDIATSAVPDDIVSLFPRTRKVGVQFGVVLVKQHSHWFEVATFRQDINYADGRRPERVVFTSASEDARRRDFTINGLFYDPQTDQVIDYVGGRQDLEAKLVRAIGEPSERFAEDHLRMLRAVRFATRFDFHLDPATADAIRRLAPRLTRISPERIREELEKMLVHPSRAQAISLIANVGLMPYLWPEADWPAERVHQAVAVLSWLPRPIDFVLGLAALLHNRPVGEVEMIGRALRCSNREVEDATWLVGGHPQVGRTPRLSLAEFKMLAAHPRFESLLILHRAVCEAYAQSSAGHQAALRLYREIPADQIAPPPLLTGDDLIALGLEPGPSFKQILDALYKDQLNNELRTREEAIERLRTLHSGE